MINTQPEPVSFHVPDLASSYDVIVIGAGPAGCTSAALIAEKGLNVLLLERESVPRFHVGESLIPETYWTLERLGLVEKLAKSAFPKKFSVQFVTETGKESAPFYFDEYKNCPSSQTWQVIRSEFDLMMINNAIEKGADVQTDASVTEVLFDQEKATGVKVKLKSTGETKVIQSKVIVDATGQSAFLSNRLKIKNSDPDLRMATVWSYFKGVLKDTGRDEGATIILQTPEKKSWFWFIPLPDDTVSIGCTGKLEYMFDGKTNDLEEIFEREVARCPGIQRRLANAEREARYFSTKDFSYRSSQCAGEGWVLVGDAFGFLDPVYSSGVFLALKSGEYAADAIVEAFRKEDFSAEKLGCWYEEYKRGLSNFKNLIMAFYKTDFSFGSFLMEYPQYKNHLVDILIGDVFKPEVEEMFVGMEEYLRMKAAANS